MYIKRVYNEGTVFVTPAVLKTDRQTDRQTDRKTDIVVHREVTLLKKLIIQLLIMYTTFVSAIESSDGLIE